MPQFTLRAMRADEYQAVADIICASIRTWYASIGKTGRFPGGPTSCLLFPQVYEGLDPGCCLVAEDVASGRLAASCFYHPRSTHVALGIMTAHPDYFRSGVARPIVQYICDFADRAGLPIRLVSSAMNLDSFSLYTRFGFTARSVFHDMTVKVPADGFAFGCDGLARVRPGRPGDAAAMTQLEFEITGIRRDKDWAYLLENSLGIWKTLVIENSRGRLDGFLSSIAHPASNMLGPGVMRTEADAAALILAQLNVHRGQSPVWLVPAVCGQLIQQLYGWGFRNCEIHVFQCRGPAQPFNGVAMGTFMPETG